MASLGDKTLDGKKALVLSAIFMISITQLFQTSINNFAQMIEIWIYAGIIFCLWKRKALPAAILFGLSIYTHFATPLFFGIFLLLAIKFDGENRGVYSKTLIAGVLIGLFWILRLLIYADWIQPNYLMSEHYYIGMWFWRFGVEGFSFFILLMFLALFFLLNKKIFKSFFSDRLNKLLLLYSIAFIPAFYYPERAIAYVSLPLILFAAQIFVKHFKKALAPALISTIIAVVALKIFSVYPVGSIFYYAPGVIFFIVLFSTALIISYTCIAMNFHKKFSSKAFFVIFTAILFFNPVAYGIIYPITSGFYSADTLMQVPEEADAAVSWLAEKNPGAIVLSTDTRLNCLGIAHGLKTTSMVVMEFGKKGMDYNHTKYATHLILYAPIEGEDQALDWNGEAIKIYDISKMKNFQSKAYNPYG